MDRAKVATGRVQEPVGLRLKNGVPFLFLDKINLEELIKWI